MKRIQTPELKWLLIWAKDLPADDQVFTARARTLIPALVEMLEEATANLLSIAGNLVETSADEANVQYARATLKVLEERAAKLRTR